MTGHNKLAATEAVAASIVETDRRSFAGEAASVSGDVHHPRHHHRRDLHPAAAAAAGRAAPAAATGRAAATTEVRGSTATHPPPLRTAPPR